MTTAELALRTFVSEHDAALCQAACLLAGRRGSRLFDAVRNGLDQPGPLTRRLRRLLLELRAVLFLDHAHEEEWKDAGCFGMSDPEASD